MEKNNPNFFLPAHTWNDYELLDSGEGMKLERFGKYVLARPDPQAIWKRALPKTAWDNADGIFRGGGDDDPVLIQSSRLRERAGGLRHAADSLRRTEGGGKWQLQKNLEARWQMRWPVRPGHPGGQNISFFVEPTPFRHVGVFPEQASQWEWIHEKISTANRPVKVLNLFGYTGIASLVAASAGAEVTHVDASKKIIAWGRENQRISGLENKPIRWIIDDALKFVRREVRRGARYDGFIIDPPKFGRGPKGEIWKVYEDLPLLLDECQKLFSDTLLFLNLTCYAIRITPLSLRYALEERLVGRHGTIEQGDLALREQSSNRLLPQAVCARWSTKS